MPKGTKAVLEIKLLLPDMAGMCHILRNGRDVLALEECGITQLPRRGWYYTATLSAVNMRVNRDDFWAEKALLGHCLLDRRNFFLKFHCILNPIERIWGQPKVFTPVHTTLLCQAFTYHICFIRHHSYYLFHHAILCDFY